MLERVQAKALEDGKSDVPKDLFDFMSKATIIFLDDQNQPVQFARAIVAWEQP